MHTRACPRGLNESTGRAYRAIEYTAHQARVGPSRLLILAWKETKPFVNTLCYTSSQVPTRLRVVLVPVLAAFIPIMYVQYKCVSRRIDIPNSKCQKYPPSHRISLEYSSL